MGAEWSRVRNFIPSKRFKTDTDDTTFDAANKRTQQGLFTEADWSRLPYLVLLQVFQHLDNPDRYHAALTCKTWLLPMSSPSLWHTGQFKLNTKYSQSLITFAETMGRSLVHIRADGTELTIADISSSSRFVNQFMDALVTANNQQLVTLSLTNIRMLKSPFIYPRCEVEEKLATLLENQRKLQVLDLSNAGLWLYDGLDLLVAASLNCHTTLHTLHINGLVNQNCSRDVAHDAKFHLVVSSLSNLSHLQLSHVYLSDIVLYLLAATACNSLQLMTVHANSLHDRDIRTTSTAWQSLTSACPTLKVVVLIEPMCGVYYDVSVSKILTPSMPLHKLHWFCERFVNETLLRFRFQSIAANFQSSLRHLHIDLGIFVDIECLGDFIKRCHNLETLSVKLTTFESLGEFKIEQEIRRAIASHPTKHACTFTLNGRDVRLTQGWLTPFVGLLARVL